MNCYQGRNAPCRKPVLINCDLSGQCFRHTHRFPVVVGENQRKKAEEIGLEEHRLSQTSNGETRFASWRNKKQS